MSAAPKLKRKKKVKFCPNPLFVQWLTEWRDAAAEKGIKTQYAYGKALVALKKYPLPFQSGKAAKILDNFGDKICSMLDKKLEEHLANEAESSSTAVDVDDDSDEIAVCSPVGMQFNETMNGSTRKRKQASPRSATKRVREYIPLDRSGPYSLILTLYRNHTRPGSKGFMHKTELQDAAQPLCDKSMKMPDPGGHYTAWSSMSTLVTKGYVYKEGSPARYVITESGCELAHKLEATTGQHPITDHLPRMASLDNTIPVAQEDQRSEVTSRRSALEIPNYWYIDDRGREVTLKDRAAVTVNDDGVGFLIKCSEASLRSCSLRYKIDRGRTAPPGSCYAYLHNDDASEVCPASKSSPPANGEHDGAVEISKKTSHSHSNSRSTNSSYVPSTNSSYVPSTHPTSSSFTAVPKSRHGMDSDDMTTSAPGSERTGSSTTPTPVFSLRPGQFDVILCVDNCETTGIGGKEKGRKHVLLKELQKNGVNLDVRKLQVGDFLWVAREKGSAVPGLLQMPRRREAVLDYVVERKRMDDLCSSIQDGRFKEQKFRLKQCGLGHPVYLVEDFGSTDHMSLPAATMLQSVVNTQVIDNFFVKNTRDSKESAAYLTIMTRYLNSLYSDKTIKAYSREDMDKLTGSTDLNSPQQRCLSFREFNESSVKNKEMTVTETFAKQLLQFGGMSAEKALALTQIYQTPSDLIRAYETCSLPSDQEKMLAKVKYGQSQRNMGPALSKVVYQLYRSSNALT
ncbi:crossover junction endonuclease MUS81 [Strongylocentrotus purpuratus]|uniref:Crossover junction endonuclease MUS81 n=1 Tax=Strongylocentrotus purpuratus TaxID=7668 RepID=A0A7M7RCM6_STRPU|nr:crossover junction endonuclease MUS81 [Strongylocentrotus purpuratus]